MTKKQGVQPAKPLTESEHHRRAEKLAKALTAPVKPPDPRRRTAKWNRPATRPD